MQESFVLLRYLLCFFLWGQNWDGGTNNALDITDDTDIRRQFLGPSVGVLDVLPSLSPSSV